MDESGDVARLEDVLKAALAQLAAHRFSESALAVKSHSRRNYFSRSGDKGAIPLLSLGMVSRGARCGYCEPWCLLLAAHMGIVVFRWRSAV